MLAVFCQPFANIPCEQEARRHGEKRDSSFYMVVERGYPTKLDGFDGISKTFEDFDFDLVNQ